MECTIENAGNPVITVFKWQVGDRRENRMFLTIHLMMRAIIGDWSLSKKKPLCMYL